MKNGWILLIISMFCGILGFLTFALFGGQINAVAADLYAPIGAVVGFIAPSIVYFGNRV